MPGKHILLIDDDPAVGEAVSMMLELDGHEVQHVTNPNEALERCNGTHYDLIVTDSRMPEMSGVELARAIKAKVANQPILMITGFPPEGETEVVNAVVMKPFTGAEIRRAVATLH